MDSFEDIYRAHFDGVYRYVYTLCRDEALTEELTQETFYKALEHMDHFDGRCRLFVWLCQIAKNAYFSHLRKSRKSAPLPEDIPDSGPDLTESLEDRDAAWQLHQRLHDLREPYKEVFSLRVFGELSFAQIGALFDKSDRWARVIFYRAKLELRKELQNESL